MKKLMFFYIAVVILGITAAQTTLAQDKKYPKYPFIQKKYQGTITLRDYIYYLFPQFYTETPDKQIFHYKDERDFIIDEFARVLDKDWMIINENRRYKEGDVWNVLYNEAYTVTLPEGTEIEIAHFSNGKIKYERRYIKDGEVFVAVKNKKTGKGRIICSLNCGQTIIDVFFPKKQEILADEGGYQEPNNDSYTTSTSSNCEGDKYYTYNYYYESESSNPPVLFVRTRSSYYSYSGYPYRRYCGYGSNRHYKPYGYYKPSRYHKPHGYSKPSGSHHSGGYYGPRKGSSSGHRSSGSGSRSSSGGGHRKR